MPMIALFFGAWMMLFASIPAQGHTSHGGMEYPGWCCNGNAVNGDCQAIPARSVTAGPNGWIVRIDKGDHVLATKPHTFVIPYSEARPSTDGEYHLCLYPTENDQRCFFAPPHGF